MRLISVVFWGIWSRLSPKTASPGLASRFLRGDISRSIGPVTSGLQSGGRERRFYVEVPTEGNKRLYGVHETAPKRCEVPSRRTLRNRLKNTPAGWRIYMSIHEQKRLARSEQIVKIAKQGEIPVNRKRGDTHDQVRQEILESLESVKTSRDGPNTNLARKAA